MQSMSDAVPRKQPALGTVSSPPASSLASWFFSKEVWRDGRADMHTALAGARKATRGKKALKNVEVLQRPSDPLYHPSSHCAPSCHSKTCWDPTPPLWQQTASGFKGSPKECSERVNLTAGLSLAWANRRSSFFMQRVVMHWNRLTREVVDAPSLEAFKARLDVALGSLVWWLVTLPMAEGLQLDDHCGPFQPRPFYNSMVLRNKRNVRSRPTWWLIWHQRQWKPTGLGQWQGEQQLV